MPRNRRAGLAFPERLGEETDKRIQQLFGHRQLSGAGWNGKWAFPGGWEVIPYPVDYMTKEKADIPLQFNFAGGLGSLGGALHEFLGLFFYWLDGKTDQLFPRPRR